MTYVKIWIENKPFTYIYFIYVYIILVDCIISIILPYEFSLQFQLIRADTEFGLFAPNSRVPRTLMKEQNHIPPRRPPVEFEQTETENVRYPFDFIDNLETHIQ